MAEITLKPKETKTLRINVGDDSFELPLQGSLSRKEVMSLSSPEGTYSFLLKHVPKAILENLSMEQYTELINVWKAESEKAFGKALGES